MNRINLGILIAAVAAVAGCSNSEPMGRDFGNAVNSNIAAQVVNPTPLAGAPDFDTSGRRMGSAMERYNKNRVYPPVPAISSVAPAGTTQPQPPSDPSAGASAF